ncbi:snoRNA-binding rRNA-processing protein [Ceratocystis pirilliformis]|uniref:SnoRNA-binding rRNA-processing protein n=1 Tax=Ceratocystis pirilliformis TaxID=259994 RepID=A0ABR3YG16_9PEZI
MPKAATTPTAPRRRHNPLELDYMQSGPLKTKAPKRVKKDTEQGPGFVDAKQTRTILSLGQGLTQEDQDERTAKQKAAASPNREAFNYDARLAELEEAEDDEPENTDMAGANDDEEAWGDEDDEIEHLDVDPEDLEAYRKFLPELDQDPLLAHGWDQKPDDGMAEDDEQPTNLADLIMEKIMQHEADMERRESGPIDDELPEKVVLVYTKIGEILSRWKSGKIPKPFKVLPTIPRWEEIIQLTKPESWTANAMYEATKIFTSGKKDTSRVFLEHVLLPRVREDIYEHHKLNVHLFKAVKRALYARSAWFKGFLFPLVSNNLTSREATIIGAVLTRVSVPILHSAAALAGLCEISAQGASDGIEGGGAVNILIKALLEKKYALPWSVIDSLVFHFLRFRSVDPASIKQADGLDIEETTNARLPVVWHQCFLAFAERYKNDITEDAREALLDLILTHGHPAISPEIRKELLSGRGRGVVEEPQSVALDGDDTMML